MRHPFIIEDRQVGWIEFKSEVSEKDLRKIRKEWDKMIASSKARFRMPIYKSYYDGAGNKKITKLRAVLNFVRQRGEFNRKQFEKKFGKYPNTYSTYLTYLIRAQYVISLPACGHFRMVIKPSCYMSLRQLYNEAYSLTNQNLVR